MTTADADTDPPGCVTFEPFGDTIARWQGTYLLSDDAAVCPNASQIDLSAAAGGLAEPEDLNPDPACPKHVFFAIYQTAVKPCDMHEYCFNELAGRGFFIHPYPKDPKGFPARERIVSHNGAGNPWMFNGEDIKTSTTDPAFVSWNQIPYHRATAQAGTCM